MPVLVSVVVLGWVFVGWAQNSDPWYLKSYQRKTSKVAKSAFPFSQAAGPYALIRRIRDIWSSREQKGHVIWRRVASFWKHHSAGIIKLLTGHECTEFWKTWLVGVFRSKSNIDLPHHWRAQNTGLLLCCCVVHYFESLSSSLRHAFIVTIFTLSQMWKTHQKW